MEFPHRLDPKVTVDDGNGGSVSEYCAILL